MRLLGYALPLAVTLVSSVWADDAPVGVGDKDRVVFFGDKLVDPPGFGYMVESFIRVKYPESRARFWHVGVREYAKIETANELFNDKVAVLKPTVVVLCWGLGDGGMSRHSDVRVAKVTEEFATLVERCQRLGARVFVLTPPRPTVAKKNILSVNEYDVTVLKIGEAMKRVAEGKGVTVLDWYAASAAGQRAGDPAAWTQRDGLGPTAQSNAVAAKLIMDAWGLRPIEVAITVDWSSGTVSTTHGTAELARVGDETRRLILRDFPMPFHTGKRRASFNNHLACGDYCRILLKVEGIPQGTVLLQAPETRRKPVELSSRKLREGYNLAVSSPLTRAQPLVLLVDRIETKNQAYSVAERVRKQFQAGTPEPELVESYKTNLLSRKQYHEGMVKIIERTPRTLDLTIDMVFTASGSEP
ncbi:MAG: hypothetical protein V3W34_00160 [Phycisphaerae bacterium]